MLAIVNQVEQIARLRLAAPSFEVVTADFSAWIDVGPFANGHVRSRCYEGHGWFTWVIAGDPIRNRDVVGGSAKIDRDGTFQVDEKLCPTIVEGEDLCLGRKRRHGY